MRPWLNWHVRHDLQDYHDYHVDSLNPVRPSCFFSTHGSIMLRTQKAEEFPLGFFLPNLNTELCSPQICVRNERE
jgi:hypothetical protein